MEKKTWMLALTLIVLAASTASAVANDSVEWLADKAKIERLANEGKCEQWDVLWPWAKQGNLEARALLFVLMAPPPEMQPIHSPGSSGDLVSRMRDIIVMAVHARNYRSDWFDDYQTTIQELYSSARFSESLGGEKFLQCVKTTPSEDCADIAVTEGLVPSFEEYASQIDAFLAAGLKSTCSQLRKTTNE